MGELFLKVSFSQRLGGGYDRELHRRRSFTEEKRLR